VFGTLLTPTKDSRIDDCCNDKAKELAHLQGQQSRVLRAVLGINAAMFVGEFAAGLIIGSAALLGDSLDMLGDSLVYGFSLYAVSRGALWQARAAFAKGIVMVAFGLAVLLETARHLVAGTVPQPEWMGLVAGIALAANTLCFVLLYRHRADGLNMRSTWLCSRNDLIANVSVIGAAFAVAVLGSAWPDLLVGMGIALLFLRTALSVLRESTLAISRERREAQGSAG
jgi:cation diffusion facilitator family transporter